MVSVTIRITPQKEAGETDFDVHLIEEDGTETVGILKRANLTEGPWTANIARVSPPPATDIVGHVAGVTPARRSHPMVPGKGCRPCPIAANVIYLIAICASGVLGCQPEESPDFDCEFGSLIFNRTVFALPRSVLGLRRDK